jgi:mannose-6-phosphate isomerase-like protein (cupin superfamily)
MRMKRSRRCFPVLLLTLLPVRGAGIPDVLKSAEIDALFARIEGSLNVVAKTNYVVALRSHSGSLSPWVIHPEADEFWFVRRGSGKLVLADYTSMTGVAGGSAKQYSASAGDVVSVPRGKAYQVEASAGRFDYVAVRIFPAELRPHPGAGTASPQPMPTVAMSSMIDEALTRSNQNVLLHSAGPTLINQVVYDRAPGPWEVHMACDDMYFWRVGNGKAQIDGTLVHPDEVQPGEIRGVGVTGSRDYSVGPGDFVYVPRNTAHHMDAGNAKLGYVLVKICD